jgi:RimJ/RimL family protein N-acetyltransferase
MWDDPPIATGETIVTARLLLRRFEMEDAGLMYELDSDPAVMRYLSRERTPYAVIRDQMLPRIITMHERWPHLGRWAAHDRETGTFVGWFALDVDAAEQVRRPELSYRLRRDAWGRGLAMEGGDTVLETAFSRPDVEAVFAQTMAVNAGSRRVMEKLGMQHIRTFHVHFDDPLPGTEKGEVEYEITRDAWLRRSSAGDQRQI